ncbi:MAG: ribonuclease HI family protein, partial [Oligoflexia bacterium]|nr:ribonuclease HI family protein [Oligoflexia bacterium]
MKLFFIFLFIFPISSLSSSCLNEFKGSNKWSEKVVIYTDGASRGNPGPCSLGIQVLDSSTNKTVHKEGTYLEDKNTNNFAEYKAVIRALELAVQNGVQELILRSDSELVVRQLKREYKVKTKTLKPLYLEAKALLEQIPRYDLQHIPREENKEADALANQALDNREG